jgi:hypothetical protein
MLPYHLDSSIPSCLQASTRPYTSACLHTFMPLCGHTCKPTHPHAYCLPPPPGIYTFTPTAFMPTHLHTLHVFILPHAYMATRLYAFMPLCLHVATHACMPTSVDLHLHTSPRLHLYYTSRAATFLLSRGDPCGGRATPSNFFHLIFVFRISFGLSLSSLPRPASEPPHF